MKTKQQDNYGVLSANEPTSATALTTEEKIKALTGARASVLDNKQHLRYFVTITRDMAEDFLEPNSGVKLDLHGNCYLRLTFEDGNMWVFGDIELAHLAK